MIQLKPAPYSSAYLNQDLSLEERVEDLLSQMTLREKIGQIALVEKNSLVDPADISAYGLGGILSGAGAKPEINTPSGWKDMVEEFEQESRQSRLEIPAIYGIDAIHGHGNVPGATIFPHFIGLGATGDEGLVERVARATALELSATGIFWSYSPSLDLPEDIRWGRVYESFSSDPELSARLGSAYVRGLQNSKQSENTNEEEVAVLATAKHYVGAGSMVWGSSSNKNYKIDQGVVEVDEEKLRQEYLPVFESAIDAGVGSVMVGLQSWGDTKMSREKYLINDVLKGELGFNGFVVTDWYSVYEISKYDVYSAIVAINAGVDMVMLPFDYKNFVRNVSWAARLGLIKEERIDDAVGRILMAKFKLGLFDEKEKEELSLIGNTEHRELAREVVARSMVLLKNDAEMLPITNAKRINVAGSAAHNIGKQMGAWTIEWQGVDGNSVPEATSILDGIKEVASQDTVISFSPDGVFENGGEIADIGIAVVGESPYAEGWGDNEEPKLSEADLATIQELKKSSKKVVVVLVTGRPLIVTDQIKDWDALVVAWLPGSEGAGVADVLFGKKDFSGKLPIAWPASIQQLPITTSGKTKDNTKPLFERYFGL